MHALHRIFGPYMESGAVFRASSAGTAAPVAVATVQRWLHEKFLVYLDELLALLSHREPGIQVCPASSPCNAARGTTQADASCGAHGKPRRAGH